MKKKSVWSIRALMIVLIALCVGLSAMLWFADRTLFWIAAPFVLFAVLPSAVLISTFKKQLRQLLHRLSLEFGTPKSNALYHFPLPVVVCDFDGRMLWYNDLFQRMVVDNEEMIGFNFEQLSGHHLDDFLEENGVQLTYRDKGYCVYGSQSEEDEGGLYTLYFCENTELVRTAEEYQLSRPSVLLVMIDNYEEVFEGKKESAKSSILGSIDEAIEEFMGKTTGFFKRLNHDRFVIVIEQRHLQQIIASRFYILDKVRELLKEDRTPVTLSIGVGSGGKTLAESEAYARQALDMALGRGGDQAAVKTPNGFDFYGGVSKGVEKRTKVKTRIIATALKEFIDQSENVIVMGHRFGDLDCMGSAIGLARAIRKLGKNCFIAVDYKKNLATALIDRVIEAGHDDLFIHPVDALDIITPRTLLIITDTHNPDLLESPGIYEKCSNVVVIDHHRKMVNYIDRAVIFYHEPYSSSASEMVSELVQYLGDFKLGSLEAEALLAGIMLDTKNFVIKAGVRTFEAAAYLKGLGADTVSVRKLFSNSIDSYQRKTRIVSGAETYRNCAIAMGDFQCEDIRIVAPQAADELLGISNVDASFVLYRTGTTANITARSLGAINAQVVMEMLGGGGHQTMAATQLENTNLEKARQMLLEAIDKYLTQS